MTESVEFDPSRLLSELNDAGVRYIVIGGVAARAFGSPLITADLDVCYARDEANHEAIAGVLRRVHARLRGTEPGLPFRLDSKTIRMGDSFTFETDFGAFDLLGTPSGTSGYEDLVKQAVHVDLDGLMVPIAGVDDLIRMKRAAGRRKDLLAIEELGALREELDLRRSKRG
jgi:hypothetical protein